MSLVNSAIVALVAYIRSDLFLPPDLPELSPAFWKSVTTTEIPLDATCRRSTPNEIYVVQGRRVLKYALFCRIVEMGNLLEKPAGYIEFIETVVLSEDVLREMFEKVDARLLQGVTDILEGFHAFVAAQWNQAFCDMEHTKAWLTALFGPVMKEAGAFYVENFKAPKSKSSLGIQKQELAIPDLAFLHNLQNIQLPVEDRDTSFDSLTSSPSGISPSRVYSHSPIRPGFGVLNNVGPPSATKKARMMTVDGFAESDANNLSLLSALWLEPDLPGPSALEEELDELEYQRELAAFGTGPSSDPFEVLGSAYAPVFGSSPAKQQNSMSSASQAAPAFRLDHNGDFSSNGNLNLLDDSSQTEFDEMAELFLNFDQLKIQEPAYSDLVGDGPHPLRRPFTPQGTTMGLGPVKENLGPEYVPGSIT